MHKNTHLIIIMSIFIATSLCYKKILSMSLQGNPYIENTLVQAAQLWNKKEDAGKSIISLSFDGTEFCTGHSLSPKVHIWKLTEQRDSNKQSCTRTASLFHYKDIPGYLYVTLFPSLNEKFERIFKAPLYKNLITKLHNSISKISAQSELNLLHPSFSLSCDSFNEKLFSKKQNNKFPQNPITATTYAQKTNIFFVGDNQGTLSMMRDFLDYKGRISHNTKSFCSCQLSFDPDEPVVITAIAADPKYQSKILVGTEIGRLVQMSMEKEDYDFTSKDQSLEMWAGIFKQKDNCSPRIEQILFSSQGSFVAIRTEGLIRFSDAARLEDPMIHHDPPVNPAFKVIDNFFISSMAFSPDEEYLVYGLESGTLMFVAIKKELASLSITPEIAYVIQAHDNQAIDSIVFSSTGEHIITGTRTGEIKLWRARKTADRKVSFE